MATLVLSAAGFAAGNMLGGTILGVSSAVAGRFAGATIGRAIDSRLSGAGSAPVETGRMDRLRLMGASEGTPVARVYGRMRVAGQVIWASQFQETTQTASRSGKGMPTQRTTAYSYSVSIAVALCEGTISGIGRIWADGTEVNLTQLNYRVYDGSPDQLADPTLEAIEGAGNVPAYRGTAYVVFEDIALEQYGNRVPNFSFEVFRSGQGDAVIADVPELVRGVAMMPGTGEYALATTPAYVTHDGATVAVNENTPSGKSDFVTSVDGLAQELPKCASSLLVVSWFGNDLRAGECEISPRAEPNGADAEGMPWNVSGLDRVAAGSVPVLENRAVYGGTPSDASVIEALQYLRAQGQHAVFYPFILMEQLSGNTLPHGDGEIGQPELPWRGRISASSEQAVSDFFGTCTLNDFSPTANGVHYTGPPERSYRRFILHYAHLCKAAGGVDAFCVGSEMRELTRSLPDAGFPAVGALIRLIRDVTTILGPNTKISYAADWSEYWGYQPDDGSGDRLFHLDPLWADDDVDFIGIDNYFPSADWRDEPDHADASWGSIYDLRYLQSNIEGGEGFDWYYKSPESRDAQIRTPITDGAYDEPWVYRYKDIRGFWENSHFERIGGVRSEVPTAWQPRSKPFYFTEIGCAAIDKGANQPNRFLDPKSSESAVPHYSNGQRDELMQMQYLRAHLSYWSDPGRNPQSDLYEGSMVDMSKAHVWAWDARPFPFFPGNAELWSDAGNYDRGHWLNGRSSARSLSSVVREIANNAGITQVDTSGLFGYVRGYLDSGSETGRAALQPLITAYGLDVIDRAGTLVFQMRDGHPNGAIVLDELVVSDQNNGGLSKLRGSGADLISDVRFSYVEADADYETATAQSTLPEAGRNVVSSTEMSLALTAGEAQGMADRWLSEAYAGQDSVSFAVPLSMAHLSAGDVVQTDDGETKTLYRIENVSRSTHLMMEGTRIDADVYARADPATVPIALRPFVVPTPVAAQFLDLPIIRTETPNTGPFVAVNASPWTGPADVFIEVADEAFEPQLQITDQATSGITVTALNTGPFGVIDRTAFVDVELTHGALSSVNLDSLLSGQNVFAIGSGDVAVWEIFQAQNAVLIGPNRYRLSGLVRGQQGTDAFVPDTWPVGSKVVLLDGAVIQLELPVNQRGVEQTYRVGPSGRAVNDAAYRAHSFTVAGASLRPYRPCHLQVQRGDSLITAQWVRRTRIDGDHWDGFDVPVGEMSEQYLIRLRDETGVKLEQTVTSTAAVLNEPLSISGNLIFEVAQLSDRFGPGPFAQIAVP
ncbi:baseplate multidomain protein megatron [Nereida ignava]|uniref:baseplate multidomain protein megatron n=1 Tax=Nereida ignava TaxID=282199 RepID=UPI0030F51F98